MFCKSCNKEIDDNSTVCPHCGYNFTDTNSANMSTNTYAKIFINPDEQYIASLGGNYLNNYLASRQIKRCISVLSSQRIYLYGTMFDNNNVSITRYRAEKVVNVEDITGTGFIYTEPELWKLVTGIGLVATGILSEVFAIGSLMTSGSFFMIPTMLLIAGILLLISSLKSRKSLFYIEYAGGKINFDASIYGIAESQDFQKQIRRVQDYIKSKTK